MYCVYKHTAPNEKVYIGITSQKPEKRWENGNGYKRNILFFKAIKKYGWDAFKHEILAEGLDKTAAEEMEIRLIKELKANNPKYGYNIENGGNTLGTHSAETLKKMSEAQKGEKNHMYGKPSPMRGKKASPETIEKNRQSHLGKQSWNKGIKMSEEQKSKLRKPKSEEHKAKLSKAKSKPVICIDTGIVYPSTKVAAESVGTNRGSIANVCNGQRKTAGGYVWSYAEAR